MATGQERADLRQALERSARWNMGLAVTFVVLAVAFVVYQYLEFRRLTRPENLVAMAEDQIRDRYPEVRDTVKERLVEAAPEMAERLSRAAVRSIPEARQELVGFLGRQLAVGLDEATAFSAREFEDILRDNRDLVEEAADELKEFPDRAEKFIVNLEKRLERRWEVDVQKEARFVLKAYRGFNAKLERLGEGDRLDAEDLLARRIVRILRAMQQQQQAAAR